MAEEMRRISKRVTHGYNFRGILSREIPAFENARRARAMVLYLKSPGALVDRENAARVLTSSVTVAPVGRT